MTVYRFKDYAHADPEPDKVIEHLIEQGFTRAAAAKFEASQRPMYEVGAEMEYDDETDTLTVLSATVDKVTLVPPLAASVRDPEITDRGFAHWEPIPSTHGGEIRVYESSAADGPHLWVGVEGEAHLTGPPRPVAAIPYGVAPGSCAAHITMEGARRLRDSLDAAIRLSEERFED